MARDMRPVDVSDDRAVHDLAQLEREAQAFHVREVPDAVSLWRDGLRLLGESIEFANGREDIPIAVATQIALLLSAYQALILSHRLASQGYYLHALNLIRAPFEYQTAIHYLHFRPQEHDRFINLAKETPSFNDLKQGIASDMRRAITENFGSASAQEKAEEYASNLQTYINELHPFSHVDKRSVELMTDSGSHGTVVLLGPQQDARLFRGCAERACGILALLLDRLVDIRRDLDYEDLLAAYEYADRLMLWKADHVEPTDYGEDPKTAEDAGEVDAS